MKLYFVEKAIHMVYNICKGTMSLGGDNMDKIIDFNELKNRVNDKDVDQFDHIFIVYIIKWLKENYQWLNFQVN